MECNTSQIKNFRAENNTNSLQYVRAILCGPKKPDEISASSTAECHVTYTRKFFRSRTAPNFGVIRAFLSADKFINCQNG